MDALFPLPLTPFETLLWLDGQPGFPMDFYFECRFAGSLDHERLRAAAEQALARHPLLLAHVTRRRGQWCWEPATNRQPQLLWLDQPLTAADNAWRPIDLARETGVRLVVHPAPPGARLVLQFHHAATDGLGALNFLGDLLAIYHHLVSRAPGQPDLPRLDPGQLVRRGDHPPPSRPASWMENLRRKAESVWRFTSFRPTPLAAPAGKPHAAGPAPFRTGWLSADIALRLRSAAAQGDAQLNDLLLRELFLAIAEWNARRGQPRRWQRIRVAMPVSLRPPRQRHMPAANIVGYQFLQRTGDACQDPAAMLAEIVAETRTETREFRTAQLHQSLARVARLPLVLPAALKFPFCLATTVLSNLGDPVRRMTCRVPRDGGKLVVGDAVLESLAATPPVRRHTRVSMAVMSYAGGLSLMALGCPETLGPAGLAEFQYDYLRRLESTALSHPALTLPTATPVGQDG